MAQSRQAQSPQVQAPQVQAPPSRAQEEHEFWERQFDPAAPAPPPRPVSARPTAVWSDSAWERALEWLRDRRGDPRAAIVGLVLVAVAAGFVWYRIGVGGGAGAAPPVRTDATASGATSATSTPTDTPSTASSGSTASSTPASASVVVHVAGAVVHPGVVELQHDARVIDAVEAVGGATPDGDLDRLNLAAFVADGSRLYVPKRGEADPGVLGGSAPTGGVGAPTATQSPDAKVNLNTASQEQLEELPGIGPTYAQAIIAERTQRGGFTSVNELREVRGIGEKRFAELAPLVTV